MDWMTSIWDNWLAIAFCAPMCFAMMNVIDVYFVDAIYNNEFDGTIISGMFQVVPWMLVPWVTFELPEPWTMLLAVAGGLLFLMSSFFYFKTLFISNDAVVAELFSNLSMVVVPVLSFLFVNERLTTSQYIGILLSFIGAGILSLNRRIREQHLSRVFLTMLAAVFFLSVSMITEGVVYKKTGFWSGFLFFSFGCFIGGIIFWIVRNNRGMTKQGSLLRLSKRYLVPFLIAEGLAVCGVTASQRAIDLSPSVSFVSVINEGFQPAFTVLFSLIIAVGISLFSGGKYQTVKDVYEKQLVGVRDKVVAIFIMALGVYLIA